MKRRIFFAAICTALFLTACSPAAPAASPTAAPTAEPAATPTPAPTGAPEPSTEVTAAPTPAPEESSDLTGDIETLSPLLKAHMLAILNGGTPDSTDSTYVWQTLCYALDGCGLDFYAGETLSGPLPLSRGVVEEIASALFPGMETLPEIPESLSGEVTYDEESDTYARYLLLDDGFSVSVTAVETGGEGAVTLDVSLLSGGETTAAGKAVLTPNRRAGNSLFTLSIQSITLS